MEKKIAIFKMREGSTEFPASYAGTEVPIEIPRLFDTAEENWREILRFCAGENDDERSRAAVATFSAKIKLDKQKGVKEVAGTDGEFLDADALARIADDILATDASRDYGTVKRAAPTTALKAQRDAAQAAAEHAIAALERLRDTLKGAAKAAVQAEIDALLGVDAADDTN